MERNGGRILVAGAINTDLVATMARAPRAGETITGSTFAIHGGGKSANQTIAAARAGAAVTLIGAVGDDDFGRARRAGLERDGVDTRWIATTDAVASGVALIFVEEGGENRIAYVPGATLTVTADHAVAALAASAPSYLLATNELPAATLSPLFATAQRGNVTIVLNATPEPSVARDLLPFVSVLIVNEGEALALLDRAGDALDAKATVRALRQSGIGTVVLTAGKAGAWVGDDGGVELIPAPRVRVVDTTGAGDTFCGTFVAELAASASTRDAAKFAVMASAISVTRAGAQSSIPYRNEVLARLRGTHA